MQTSITAKFNFRPYCCSAFTEVSSIIGMKQVKLLPSFMHIKSSAKCTGTHRFKICHMQWEIKKGVVTDEQGEMVCLLADTASDYHIALIKNAAAMFDAITKNNRSIENTRLPRDPRKQYEEFKKLEDKIKADMQ